MINTLNLKLNIKNLFKRNLYHSPIIWTLCLILQVYSIYFCVCIIKPFYGNLLYLSTVGTILLIVFGLIFSQYYNEDYTHYTDYKFSFIQNEEKKLTKLNKINIKKYSLIIKYSFYLLFILIFYHIFFNLFSLPALGCFIYSFYYLIIICKSIYPTQNMHIDFTKEIITFEKQDVSFNDLKEIKVCYEINKFEKIFIVLKNNEEILIIDQIGYIILSLLLKKYGITINIEENK